MKERITYLDTAKGILILMMLVGHIWNDGIIHNFIYVFHMPAFFIISGMLGNTTSLSFQSFGKFLFSRIRSLIIPYVFFEIYAILMDIACNGAYLNWKGYAYQILTLQLTNGPLWFLMVMFISGAVCYILRSITAGHAKIVVVVVLLTLVMIMPQYQAYISPSTVTLATLYTMIGFYAKDVLTIKSLKGGHVLVLFLSTLPISFANIGEMPDYQSGSRILFLLGSLVGTVFIVELSKRVDCKCLQFLGQNSLVILGSHYPIIRVVKHIFGFEEFSVMNGLLFLVVLILVEALFIYFINRFLPFAAGKKGP